MDAKFVKGNIGDYIEVNGNREDLEKLASLLEKSGIKVKEEKVGGGWGH